MVSQVSLLKKHDTIEDFITKQKPDTSTLVAKRTRKQSRIISRRKAFTKIKNLEAIQN